MDNIEELGVFGLLTELCNKTASKYCYKNELSHRRLVSKMRSHSYEVILKKTSQKITMSIREPVSDLLSYYFTTLQNCRNVTEFKKSQDLKKIVSIIREYNFGENNDSFFKVLQFLISLCDTVKEDLSMRIFETPCTYGLLDDMLPKLNPEKFGSPQPYSYFPSYIFELPYSLKRQKTSLEKQNSQTYSEYTVESFDSKSFLLDNSHSRMYGGSNIKTFSSPMSLPSLRSNHLSPYFESSTLNYPKLTAPRDMQIPLPQSQEVRFQIAIPKKTNEDDVKDIFDCETEEELVDIWELASQVDKDIPSDIWELVSKLPPIEERQLIASSSREMKLWRWTYEDELKDLNIISEKQFIRHVMYLTIGIETSSFPFDTESNCFYMRDNLVLEGVSKLLLKDYATTLILIGTYYRRLYKFAFNQTLDDHFHSNGLVYEASREVIRRYLLEFRLKATKIYERCQNNSEGTNCMPTLLEIMSHIEPLKYEIETLASIYKLIDTEYQTSIPTGAELMSYLFNEISLVTHTDTASVMYNSLFSVCKVYFKFIERFIFEGELDDGCHEFFIRKDTQYVNCRSKRYWDKGFHITQSVAIPDFLRAVAKYILLCGKSLRLLKLCNPSDPLLVLISSDHPSVKCCGSFEELQQQQRLLDVYRTRCLFVSGEPLTFSQVLLKRDADTKAFAEVATLKQAETMEKIIAERKRLAQLIVAEKQHSLRVLEAAMAEAEAARVRRRSRPSHYVPNEKQFDETDAKDERNKMMEYYSKLNMEVKKSKIHTEWKIKRLQLDQSRIKLLSTEERNLKREKLELEHQRNEEVMAMSIQSLDANIEAETDTKSPNEENIVKGETDVTLINEESATGTHNPDYMNNKSKAQTSSDVFNAICNVAKSIFGVSRSSNKNCDNNKTLDAQGNVVALDAEGNSENSDVQDDTKVDNSNDNLNYQTLNQEVGRNKGTLSLFEFNTDKENNDLKNPPLVHSVDEMNNIQVMSTYAEAKRNKMRVLGTEFDRILETVEPVHRSIPRTDAQREALLIKQKVLGVEYNTPIEVFVTKEPLNEAQIKALENRKKVLGSDSIKSEEKSPRRGNGKRAGLTLNLKPIDMSTESSAVTPNLLPITPGELFPRLDLETPNTADLAFEEAVGADLFTPQSDERNLESGKSDKETDFSKDFDMAGIVDETADVIDEIHSMDSPDAYSPKKSRDNDAWNSKLCINFIDGSYSLDSFDPFGVKDLLKFNSNYFNQRMDCDMESSCYTHPAVIMEELKKRPSQNFLSSHFTTEVDDEQNITCDNIASLTACLQRSVMLPLTYQLEVVNNSILTHFLVNLDMYEHLKSLKDYFFLMDGEFSRSICQNLFSKLSKTLNPQELLNFGTLHNILDKALGSSISHVHKFSENVSFVMSELPLSFQQSSPDVLSCLSLSYAVRWPLNIILSQEALLRYAKVFQFLVKMRRVFWTLGEDFEYLKLSVKLSKQQSRRLLRSPQYIAIQTYRHVMASLVRALDNYIVTTCILSSWTEFENDLKKARTLDDLYDCHVVYIKKVLFRCLLNNRSTLVMKLLNDIFTVILKFSRVLITGEWTLNEVSDQFTHTNFAQIEELFNLFKKLTKYLHKVVTKLMECGYQRHLVELLTMINFNGYYDMDKSKDDTNNSVQLA